MSMVYVYDSGTGRYATLSMTELVDSLHYINKLRKAKHRKWIRANDMLKMFGFPELGNGDVIEVCRYSDMYISVENGQYYNIPSKVYVLHYDVSLHISKG